MSRHQALPIPIDEAPCALWPERGVPPFCWTDVFGGDGPVELEIGCGKGLFLTEAARQRPDANFVGVERADKWFHRAVARCLRSGLANVRVVRHDAFDLLDRWVAPESLAAVHVYFPDPWPKRRHAGRRLLQDALFRLAARALAPGAPLLLASDVRPYFEQALREIDASGRFEQTPWPEEGGRLPTSYARKYEALGRPLYYARFVSRVASRTDAQEHAPVVGLGAVEV